MGLFSSKKKTSVGTTVTPVIEEKFLPNSIFTGTVDSIFNGTDLADTILKELSSNIGVKAQQFYKYAEKHYPYGLPGQDQYSTLQGEKEARNIIQGILGMHVSIEYSFISSKNPMHFAWEHITKVYGYDNTTNQLHNMAHANGTVYLYDMVYELGRVQADRLEPTAFEVYGRAASSGNIPRFREFMAFLGEMLVPSPPIVKDGSHPEIIRMTIATLKMPRIPSWYAVPDLVKEDIIFNVSDVLQDRDGDFIHVGYRTTNGKMGYWSYELGAGEFPALDRLVHNPSPPPTGKYFPFTYFRFNKTPEGTNKNSQAYKTSTRMLRLLGLNYQDIIENVNKNPDIKDVEQAMMVFTVPVNSKDPISLRYTYDYFSEWYARQPDGKATINAILSSWTRWRQGNVPPVDVTEIRDKRFRMALSHKGISRKIRAGKIGNIGHITTSTREYRYTKKVDDENGRTRHISFLFPVHVFQKQISGSIYEELEVLDLKHTYYIWNGHNVVADEDDPILHIPIDLTILNRYSLADREALYSRSLNFVFNSRVTQKVKWYQTGIFKVFLTIAAVAVAVFTSGASLAAWASALAAGGAAASAALMAMMKTILVGLAISYGTQLVAENLGITVAIVLAVVVAAVGVADAIQAKSLTASAWAGDLLSVSNSLVNAAGNAMQKELIGIQNEFEDFYNYATEAVKTLESANEMLYSSPILSPFTFIGESPQDYYNRSVRLLNPGLEGIRGISTYAERSLQLPTFLDSVQEIQNGLAHTIA